MRQVRADSQNDADRFLRLECLRLGYEEKRLGALSATAEELGEKAWAFVNRHAVPGDEAAAERERRRLEEALKAKQEQVPVEAVQPAPVAPAPEEGSAAALGATDEETGGGMRVVATGGGKPATGKK